jgi:hypothetical protein
MHRLPLLADAISLSPLATLRVLSTPGLGLSPLAVLPPNNLVNLVGVPVSFLGGTGLLLRLAALPGSSLSFSALVITGLASGGSIRGTILRLVEEMNVLDDDGLANGSLELSLGWRFGMRISAERCWEAWRGVTMPGLMGVESIMMEEEVC